MVWLRCVLGPDGDLLADSVWRLNGRSATPTKVVARRPTGTMVTGIETRTGLPVCGAQVASAAAMRWPRHPACQRPNWARIPATNCSSCSAE